jgi:hypothetical protein
MKDYIIYIILLIILVFFTVEGVVTTITTGTETIIPAAQATIAHSNSNHHPKQRKRTRPLKLRPLHPHRPRLPHKVTQRAPQLHPQPQAAVIQQPIPAPPPAPIQAAVVIVLLLVVRVQVGQAVVVPVGQAKWKS